MFLDFFKKIEKKPVFLYNTLSRQKEEFKPIKNNFVGMYACGPTVYGFPHLGNMRAYVFEDILKRVLEYNNLKVKHVMNITDVGHLTGDRDAGEDKIEKEATKEGKTAWEIADFYTRAFKEDLKNLNIVFPDIFCKATDNIKEQIDLILKLEEKDYTYRTTDGIYFDTSKVTDYTKLSHQKIEDLKEGARVEANPEKKNPTDFALWKFSPKNLVRQMEWQSPWGIGFPGWHIECSAMSLKYLGDHFDIHCGGIDHIDVHHTNEIAQTEAATGKKPWVNVWMHVAFLNMSGGRKMSKSSGDLVTLNTEFINKNIDPLAYRFGSLSTHYRKPTEWSDEVSISSKNGLENLHAKILNLGDKKGKVNKVWKDNFVEAINDDLNLPQGMAILNEMLKSEISKEDKLATALDFDKVLGLKLDSIKLKSDLKESEIPKEVQDLIKEREQVRKNKDWIKSDQLREEIVKLGYEIKDTPEGTEIKKM